MCRKVTVVVCSVCLSVKSHLNSGASVLPENTVTYSAGNSQKLWGFLKPLSCRDPALPPLKAIHTVGHFPADSPHVHLRVLHFSSSRWILIEETSHYVITYCFPLKSNTIIQLCETMHKNTYQYPPHHYTTTNNCIYTQSICSLKLSIFAC